MIFQMNYHRIIMLVLFAGLLSTAMPAQDKQTFCVPVKTLERDSLAFDAGERMSFTLNYQWGALDSDVGTATVKLEHTVFNGQDAFLCKVYGATTWLFDRIFKVREDFRSWFSTDGLRPLKFTRDTHEGKYAARNTYLYQWDDTEPHIDADVYSTSSGERSVTIPLTKCTFDLPALFFFARNMDFDKVEPGVKYPMTFAIDDDVYNVHFIMYDRQTVKVKGLGTVNTVRFGAHLLAGEVFKGDQDMTIWISDDLNRLPVLFEAPLIVGKASGRMTSVSGLKHPFSSLVKK